MATLAPAITLVGEHCVLFYWDTGTLHLEGSNDGTNWHPSSIPRAT